MCLSSCKEKKNTTSKCVFDKLKMCVSIEFGPVKVNAATLNQKGLQRTETETDVKEIKVAP